MLVVLVAIAVCVVGLGVLVDPARAFSVATPQAGPIGEVVHGHRNGRQVQTVTALAEARINGETEFLLGADLSRPVQYGVDFDEGEWDAGDWASGADLAKATRVVNQADWARHRDAVEISAVSAALWHYTDHFDLDRTDARNDRAVVARYDDLVADAEGHPEPTRHGASMQVSPPPVTVTAHEPAFLAVTGDATAPWSLVAADARATVHPAAADGVTCDLTQTLTAVTGPSTICLTVSDAPGPRPIDVGLVVRSAATWADSGRVFHHAGRRTLVMADRASNQSVAVAQVTVR